MKLFTILFSFLAILSFGFAFYYYLERNNRTTKNTQKRSLVIVVSLVLLAFSSYLLAVSLDITNDLIINTNLITKDYTKVGPYGDLIGGIMNPIVAFIGIIAASLAFYAQYIANKQVQNEFKIQQFENQFYERLKLIKEEINNIYLPTIEANTLLGRKVFYELDKEIKFIYFIVSNRLKELDKSYIFPISYQIFYKGRKNFFSDKNLIYVSKKYNIRKKDLLALDDIFISIYQYFFNLSNTSVQHNIISDESIEAINNLERIVSEYLEKLDDIKYNELFEDLFNDNSNYHYSYLIFKDKYDITFNHIPFKGMETKLSLILRQLFSLVKFVANDNTFNYIEKRNYLRVLRSILSNYEQLHVFYNWYSGTGSQWEDSKNKFLTDYRMIHNLPPDFLIEGFDLETIFADRNFEYEENRKLEDSLFEQIDIFSAKA